MPDIDKQVLQEPLTKEGVIKLAKKLAYRLPGKLEGNIEEYDFSMWPVRTLLSSLYNFMYATNISLKNKVKVMRARFDALRVKLEMNASQVSELEADCKLPAANSGFAWLFNELTDITEQHPGCQITWPTLVLTIPVGEVSYADKNYPIDLGKFTVKFHLEELIKQLKSKGADPDQFSHVIMADADDPVYSLGKDTDDIYHPHVYSDGAICFGSETSVNCCTAFNELRLSDVLDMTKAVLRSYNSDSAYALLPSWNEEWVQENQSEDDGYSDDEDLNTCMICDECSYDVRYYDCGHYACESHNSACDDCETNVCEACQIYCDCGKTVCKGCSTRCRDCDSRFCSDCVIRCSYCNVKRCVGCIITCETCNSKVCGTCNINCDLCGKDKCKNCTFNCVGCGKRSCDDCLVNCAKCNGTYCPECLDNKPICGSCTPDASNAPTPEVINVPSPLQEESENHDQSSEPTTAPGRAEDIPDLFGDMVEVPIGWGSTIHLPRNDFERFAQEDNYIGGNAFVISRPLPRIEIANNNGWTSSSSPTFLDPNSILMSPSVEGVNPVHQVEQVPDPVPVGLPETPVHVPRS
jgi:hypothetical protein